VEYQLPISASTYDFLPGHFISQKHQRFDKILLLAGVDPIRSIRLITNIRTEIVSANHQCQHLPVMGHIDSTRSLLKT
jgi:hypothetical protein